MLSAISPTNLARSLNPTPSLRIPVLTRVASAMYREREILLSPYIINCFSLLVTTYMPPLTFILHVSLAIHPTSGSIKGEPASRSMESINHSGIVPPLNSSSSSAFVSTLSRCFLPTSINTFPISLNPTSLWTPLSTSLTSVSVAFVNV